MQDKYLRTLLHEVMHYRNIWAHQAAFDHRQTYRLVDTIILMADVLKYDHATEYYTKLLNIRLYCLRKMMAELLGQGATC